LIHSQEYIVKILFLVSRLDNASTRQRVLQYRRLLEREGMTSQVLAAPQTLRGKIQLWLSLPRFDVLFIQRRLFQPWEVWWMRQRARHLVYDLDDAVMFKDRGAGQERNRTRRIKFRSLVKRCDLVIAGNRYLWQQVLPFNDRVEILPTCVDLERYRPKTAIQKDGITLGWIGSRSTLGYLENLREVLEEVGKRYRQVELKIVADGFFDAEIIPVIKKTWDYATEITDLHSFDIGLMPLTDDVWSRGKCGFKLIQCMAVGVPVVCSPVGMNREIVEHGVNGWWAETAAEWLEALSALIESPRLRFQFGGAGRETVAQRYSLQVNAPRLAQFLRQHLP
jgi:glycosyltransferase involved in cell wall biosynthesis